MYTAQLVQRVQEALGDPQGLRYAPMVILGKMQEAQRDFLRKCRITLRATAQLDADLDATPAYSVYTLPANFHRIEKLRYNGQDLAPVDLESLSAYWANWEGQTGAPLFYLKSSHWGSNRVRVVPYPDDQAVNLTLYYTRQPSSLLEYDEPDIPPAYHMALAHYAVWHILLDDPAFSDEARRDEYKALYLEALQDAIQEAGRDMSNETPEYHREYF